MESSLLALNTIFNMWYLVFLPNKWATLMLSGQDFITVTTALYGNCEVQVLFQTFVATLTVEGFTGLLTRTIMGFQAELPFYYTKFLQSDRTCIQGESAAKMFSLIFDYQI